MEAPPFSADAPAVVADDAPRHTVLWHRRSPVQDVWVVEEDGLVLLRFDDENGNDQSALDPKNPRRLVFEYVRLAALGTALVRPRLGLPRDTAPAARRGLVVGLGGGAFPGWLVERDAHVHVDAVEIDPVVVDVARRFFRLPQTPRLEVHLADGAAFLARARAGYDVILLDAFSGDSIPAALSSAAFFADARRVLADGGVAILNIALVSSDEASAILRRFTAAFPGCVVVRGRKEDNLVVFGARAPLSVDAVRSAAVTSTATLGFDVLDDVGAVRACP